jgi:multicomponent Na+:H+ antiporter subunit F
MNGWLWAMLWILLGLVVLCLYRAAFGPTVADRMVAINVIGTKTVVLVVGVSIAIQQPYFVDIALVYGLIGFVATVGVASYLNRSGEEAER